MDLENNGLNSQNSQPQPANYAQIPCVAEKPHKTSFWKVLWGIFTFLSILANIGMFFLLIGFMVYFSGGKRDFLLEDVIKSGSNTQKIAVLSISGVIANEQSVYFQKQIKMAKEDSRIKGLIIKVNSPGGTISGSDEIYNEIIKYREKTGKPVIAFMQGMAASGGYYASAGCEKIIAEPTTITGSIGVIMSYLVLKDLLEGKLGIQPVVIKSGLRKDWPSSFSPPTAEQLEYMQTRLINPAYERFLEIVTKSRMNVLEPNDVRKLADGGIYGALEAKKEKLIDEIGYMDEAIDMIAKMAKISNPHVIEYKKPFSFASFLEAEGKSSIKFDRTTLLEFTSPQVLYMWSGY